MYSISIYCLQLTKEHANSSVTDQNPTLLIGYFLSQCILFLPIERDLFHPKSHFLLLATTRAPVSPGAYKTNQPRDRQAMRITKTLKDMQERKLCLQCR